MKPTKLTYKNLDNHMNKMLDIIDAISHKIPMMDTEESSLWWAHTADLWEFHQSLKDAIVKLEETLKN